MKNFQEIEGRIKKAISKVQVRLAVLSALHCEQAMLHPDYPIWNDLHDLEARLNDRLWDNWSEYKSANWDIHGFNTY